MKVIIGKNIYTVNIPKGKRGVPKGRGSERPNRPECKIFGVKQVDFKIVINSAKTKITIFLYINLIK